MFSKDKEIAKAEPAQQASISPLAQIAMSKDISTERLKDLLEIQKDYEANEAKKAYSLAMSECQKEMPLIVRNAVNPQTQSNYAKHEIICQAIKPVYTQHGFSLSFHEGEAKKPEEMRIIGDINHAQGHSKQIYIDLPYDGAGIKGNVNKTPVHAKGSTFSYGRRYLTLMGFDLATYDDNDANIAQPAVEYITEDQVNTIHSMISESNLDMKAFLKYIKKDSIEVIPKTAFNWVIESIKAVIAKRAKK